MNIKKILSIIFGFKADNALEKKSHYYNEITDHIKNVEFEGKNYEVLSTITYDDIRKAIDKMGYASGGKEDKQLVSLTLSGKGANAEVVIAFVIEENWLKMYSYADLPNTDIHLGNGNIPGMNKDDEGLSLLKKLNEYNRTTRYAKAYLEDGVVFLERNNYACLPPNEDEKGDDSTILPMGKDYLLKNFDAFITVSALFFNNYLFEITPEAEAIEHNSALDGQEDTK